MTRGARFLRIVATAAIAVAVVVGVAYIGSREATRVEPGDPAPDLELPSVGGAAITKLSDYRGRPVLLVMFHSAAPFSQQETPDLERLHRTLLRKGLVVLGVDVDADPKDRERFLRDNVVTFIVLEDPGGREVRKVYEARRFPQRYLIDAGGVVRQVWLGPVDWSSREVLGQIQALLPGGKQPS
ncbi:MAG TPA: TlpA disulfide reductase family protein [Vicinamibacteria bacterium]